MRRALLAPLAIAALFGIVAVGCSSDPEVETVVETVDVVEEEVVPEETVEDILIATPTTPPAGESKFGGTLRTVSQASVASLDSVWTEAYVTIAVASHIFETPLGWNSKIEEQPRMAESWELSSDKLTYTFHLRDGLKFHDGTAVEAGDKAQAEALLVVTMRHIDKAANQNVIHANAANRKNVEHMLRLVAAGKLRPLVSKTLPLERWREAFGDMMGRRVVGKVCLTMAGPSGAKL